MGQETPPAPELVQVSSGVSSGVVLRCLAPADHRGRVFKLYRKYTLIFSQRFDSERSYADFHLNNITADTAEIYCCSYDYSAFSPYTHISAPPRPITPATPQLSVTPADGRVQPGQMVEFYCQAPPTPTPVEFIFQKRSWEGQDLQIVSRSTSPHFRMGHVVVSDGGMYTCFYLLNKPEGVQNSAPSTRVSLNVRGSMDLPLVCGSISAALLFLMVLLFMFFGIRKYAKKSAKKRRQRAQEQFWKQVHSRDHIIDLTLQRVSTGSTVTTGTVPIQLYSLLYSLLDLT
ncbi:hypothetical protein C0J45_8954 [Silurus meridionalis]|nr:hypothetical protein C0J45_8954 [Silurus meridionalis]